MKLSTSIYFETRTDDAIQWEIIYKLPFTAVLLKLWFSAWFFFSSFMAQPIKFVVTICGSSSFLSSISVLTMRLLQDSSRSLCFWSLHQSWSSRCFSLSGSSSFLSSISVLTMRLLQDSSRSLCFWSLHQSWSSRCFSLSGLP